jgi:integrase
MLKIEILKDREIMNAKQGLHADGGNLYLRVRNTGSKSWVFRWRRAGRTYELGLGAYPAISLKAARKKAKPLREALSEGLTPKIERPKENITFADAVEEYLNAKLKNKSTKHINDFRNSLSMYAYPFIGKLYPREIELSHVLKILKQSTGEGDTFWETKTETASRVRGRIERVLGFCKGNGWRSGDNPAEWAENLEALLPKKSEVFTPDNFVSLPYRYIPAFWQKVSASDAMSALAVRWVILTACRSNEARAATWQEIDRDARTWTVPASRSKTKKEHVVHLTDEALAILGNVEPLQGLSAGDLLFPSQTGKPLSDVALAKTVKRYAADETMTVHGFRSTFRTWSQECAYDIPDDVLEMALAHTNANKVKIAYARSDLQELRAKLLTRWAMYVTGVGNGY